LEGFCEKHENVKKIKLIETGESYKNMKFYFEMRIDEVFEKLQT